MQTTIDCKNEKLINLEKKRWILVLERIIYVIEYLAEQNLAFRGSSEKLFEQNNGNFLKMIETMSIFDNVLAEHIRRIQSDSKHLPHYLGHNIQNEFISILGPKVKNEIIDLLHKSKYYSVILDCTPDISHQEQITIVIRFVHLNEVSKKVEIREHFLSFFPVTDMTGQGLTNFLLNFFDNEYINLNDLRGQGHDNGANMKEKNNGLQQKILDINPRAFFMPCRTQFEFSSK